MKTERKQIAGVMNLDDSNDVLPSGHHKEARNIVFRGSQGSVSAQNILGNRNIATSLPAGTNSCIGSHYDAQNKDCFTLISTQMVIMVYTYITLYQRPYKHCS